MADTFFAMMFTSVVGLTPRNVAESRYSIGSPLKKDANYKTIRVLDQSILLIF